MRRRDRPATDVGALTARLNAHGHTDATPGHFEFQYAMSPGALGTSSGSRTPTRGPIPAHVPAGGGDVAFGEHVGGLRPGTTYHFRVCGGDEQVKPDACGGTRSFTTAASPLLTRFPRPTDYPGAGTRTSIVTGPDGSGLWFVDDTHVDRAGTDGTITKRYPVTAARTEALGPITVGSDGAIWFSVLTPYTGDLATDALVRLNADGTMTMHVLPFDQPEAPNSLVSGPDGALWFISGSNGQSLGRMTTGGAMRFAPLTAGFTASGLTSGPDGALWYTERDVDGAAAIGRMTTAGTVTKDVPLPRSSSPGGIVAGPDGALWFTETGAAKIGRVTTAGALTEYPLPAGADPPTRIAVGPDGALWFVLQRDLGCPHPRSCPPPPLQRTSLGRITTGGQVDRWPVADDMLADDLTAGPDGALWLTIQDRSGDALLRAR